MNIIKLPSLKGLNLVDTITSEYDQSGNYYEVQIREYQGKLWEVELFNCLPYGSKDKQFTLREVEKKTKVIEYYLLVK